MKGKYQFHRMEKTYPIEVIPHAIFSENGHSHGLLDLHWHRSIELVFVQGDSLTIWKEGKNYLLHDGDMLCINTQESHEFIIEHNKNYQGVTILISYDFLKRQVEHLDSYFFSFHVTPEVKEKLKQIMFDLLTIFQKNQEWSIFLLQSLAGELSFTLFSECILSRNFKKTKKEEKYSQRYKTVIRYINDHYAEPIHLAEVAEVVFLTPDFFSRNFKNYFGVSFKDYLKKVRLTKAVHLMVHTSENISEIAFDSGFPDQKSFIKAFKENYQTTPSKYRKKFLK